MRTRAFLRILVIIDSKFSEEIKNLFVIDLKVCTSNQKLLSLNFLIDEAKDVAH